MDTVAGRVLQGTRGQLDVFPVAAGQAADRRALYFTGHCIHALPIPTRGGRKSRLDNIDTEIGKSPRYAQLLGPGHAAAGRLLAVAQGGVEDQHSVGIGSHDYIS